jgi:hypothetical protein
MWAPLLLAAANPGGSLPTSGTDLLQTALAVVNAGVLGLVFFLFLTGRLHSDSEVGRLTSENNRLVTEKREAEERRDEALRVANEKLVPLLVNFVNVTSVLIPLLQQVVARQEQEKRGPGL